ncbi:hypothetical protein V6O07_02610, partial [Arthrospira platensis SPKY2]
MLDQAVTDLTGFAIRDHIGRSQDVLAFVIDDESGNDLTGWHTLRHRHVSTEQPGVGREPHL